MTDLEDVVARLERRAARDRAARIEAEAIAENQLRRAYDRAREVELLAAIAVLVNDTGDAMEALSAGAKVLRRHCGFAVAHVLVPDDDGAFVTSDIWDADPAQLDFFDTVLAATVDMRFVPPLGLPGEVAASHLALWLPDFATASNFPRAPALGHGAAWAFPVVSGVTVAAVIEFLNPTPRGADERLLQLAPSLGSQLARAIEWDQAQRREAADRRRLEELVQRRNEDIQALQRETHSADVARTAYVSHLVHDLESGTRRLGEALGADAEPSVRAAVDELGDTALRLVAVVEGTERRFTGERMLVVPTDLARSALGAAEAAGLRVAVSAADGGAEPVNLNVALVERALALLVDNAVRHSGSDSVDIEVERTEILLRFTVHDHGTGFVWDQSGLRPQGPSGLAQVSRLARTLGGELSILPAAGGGTLAQFTIAARPGGGAAVGTASRRVLLVDDNAINRRLAAAMLDRTGLACDVVESGEAALEALRSSAYGMVLMDVQMPGLDGRQTTQLWRSGSGGASRADVPIVALTAHVGQDERDMCAAAGMDDYLSKPFGIEDLATVARRWLDGDAAARRGTAGVQEASDSAR